jgi:hypothetical protein
LQVAADYIAFVKGLVLQRLPYRVKMTDAVRIATLVDPSSKHLIAADMSTDDIKKLLIDNTKAVISKTAAARSFRCSLPSTSTVTSLIVDSVDVPAQYSVVPAQCPSQATDIPASKKMKLLIKASQAAPSTANAFSDNNLKTESEVNTCINLPVEEQEENPVNFWKKHKVNYPNLSVPAKCYLTISAFI